MSDDRKGKQSGDRRMDLLLAGLAVFIFASLASEPGYLLLVPQYRGVHYITILFGIGSGFLAVAAIICRRRADSRMRAEMDSVRAAGAGFREAFYRNPLPMVISSIPGGRLVEVNESFLHLAGLFREEALNPATAGKPKSRGAREALMPLLEKGEGFRNVEISFREANGESRVLLCSGEPAVVYGAACLITAAEDITTRKRAEMEVAKERDLLQSLMENIPDYIYFKDASSRFTRINRAAAFALGLRDPSEAVGKTDFDFFPKEYVRDFYEQEQEIFRTGKALIGREEKSYQIDGQVHWVSTTKMPVRDGDGRVVGLVGINRDISRSKRMEEALRKSERDHRALFEQANDAILILEPDSEVILEVNSRACNLYGYTREEFIGKRLREIACEPEQAGVQVTKILKGGSCRNLSTVHLTSSGTPIEMLINASLIEYRGREAILSINRDVSEVRRLQQQLLQSEKLASLGQLVSGVAHELNNPLTSVIGFAQLLLANPALDQTTRSRLEVISSEGERTRRIVQNLLSFARQHRPARGMVDINEVITKTLELRAYEQESRGMIVELECQKLPLVLADSHQLQQVLLNVIVNAEQAMEQVQDQKKLRIRTELDDSGDEKIVRVMVSDTGPGIDPACINRVFDPFFTTKEVGKGTGLGLSISYGIVNEHGGSIRAENNPGGGSIFTIELPAGSN